MSLADTFRRAADAGRRAAAAVAQRPTAVAITTETWSGNVGADGVSLLATATTTLSPNPDENVTAFAPSPFGGGRATGGAPPLIAAAVRIGPVTPAFAGGGYAVAALNPAPVDATQRVFITLAGGQFDDAGERFDLEQLEYPTPQSCYLTAVRTQQS